MLAAVCADALAPMVEVTQSAMKKVLIPRNIPAPMMKRGLILVN